MRFKWDLEKIRIEIEETLIEQAENAAEQEQIEFEKDNYFYEGRYWRQNGIGFQCRSKKSNLWANIASPPDAVVNHFLNPKI